MTGLRWQPPVYSPLPPDTTWRSLLASAALLPDSRCRLRRTLLQDYSADAALLCGSGTQALQLALRLADPQLGSGALVAVPAFTCFAVATAVVGADARVVLYDVDPVTLAPDFDSLRLALREGAQVVVATPLFGMALNWDALEECTAPYGAVIVEDAAQGHGATWDGRPLGSFGTLSVLSFGRGKGWTGGQGGALLLRGAAARRAENVELQDASAAAESRVFLSLWAQRVLGRPALYGIPASIPWLGLGETRYKDPENPKAMSQTASAVLDTSRDVAQREAEDRRNNAAILLQRIPFGGQLREVQSPRNAQPGFLRLPLRLARGLCGFPVPQRALRLGIAPSYPHPLHLVKQVHARLQNRSHRWPGASELTRELVTLPTHSLVTSAEREGLVVLMRNYAR